MPASPLSRTRISVVLADDHRILREGLAALMSREPDLDLVATAEDGPSMLRQGRTHMPHVLGLNGIDAVQRLRAELPQVQVLCLSVHDEDRLVLAMIEAGASGYVLKDGSFDELALALRQVMLGRIYISPALSGVMVREMRRRKTGPAMVESPTLTARERQLVQLTRYALREGLSSLDATPRTSLNR